MPNKGVMHPMVRCSTPSWMIEEDLAELIEVDSAEGNMVSRLKNATPTNGKTMGTILRSLVEGGAILPDRPIATITKRSAKRRNESQLQLADNSRSMPRIPIMTIMAVCS